MSAEISPTPSEAPEKAHVGISVASGEMSPEELRNFIGMAPDTYARAGARNVHGRSRATGKIVVAPVPALYNVWRLESGLPDRAPLSEQMQILRERAAKCVRPLRSLSVREGVRITIGAQGNAFSFSLSHDDIAWIREVGAGVEFELWPSRVPLSPAPLKSERHISRVHLRLQALGISTEPVYELASGISPDAQPMVHLAALMAHLQEGMVPAERLRHSKVEFVYEVLGREAETVVDEATVEELAELKASLTVVFEADLGEWV